MTASANVRRMADKVRRVSAEARFWVKVERGKGCWLWRGFLHRGGHGEFRVGGRILQAHRFSFALRHGPIPRGYIVRHRCDVGSCVRPSHLRLGTYEDNNRDRSERGRSRGFVRLKPLAKAAR